MSRSHKHYNRVMGVAPCARGFGYAVIENGNLVDWQVKSASGDKNARCVEEVEALIVHYLPEVLVLEDTGADGSRRVLRIRNLTQSLHALALRHQSAVAFFSTDQIKQFFLGTGEGTKHDVVREIAKRFPEELGARVPPERRAWMSQDYRIDLFYAVALAAMLT